jgi:hypothetical protein
MRITLDLDDDVLASAKEIARREKKTVGQVVSELARKGLTHGSIAASPATHGPAPVHGFRPFERRGAVVTNALIEKLRDGGEC